MRQRAMIAMAMALNPALLIADEPTTALDVTVQAQVLRVIERLQEEFGTAVILITHDLGVIAEMADDVVVMYAGAHHGGGRPGHDVLRLPPSLHRGPAATRCRRTVASGAGCSRSPGQPPSLINLPPGCPFHPRCPYVMDRCRTEEPDPRPVDGDPGIVGVLAAAHEGASGRPSESGVRGSRWRHDRRGPR